MPYLGMYRDSFTFTLLSIIRRIRWLGRVTDVGEMKVASKSFFWTSEMTRTLE